MAAGRTYIGRSRSPADPIGRRGAVGGVGGLLPSTLPLAPTGPMAGRPVRLSSLEPPGAALGGRGGALVREPPAIPRMGPRSPSAIGAPPIAISGACECPWARSGPGQESVEDDDKELVVEKVEEVMA